MLKVMNKSCKYLQENEILKFSKSHKVFVTMLFALAISILCGSIFVRYVNLETLHKFDFLFLKDFQSRSAQSLREVFASSLASYCALAFVFEFLALSIFGVVLVPCLVMFKGFGVGLLAGYLYLIYGLKGIAFYILILLPGVMLSSVGLALFASNAFGFSLKIAKKTLPKPDDTVIWQSFKLHFKNCGYSMIIFCASAFVDMCFTGMFSRFFQF